MNNKRIDEINNFLLRYKSLLEEIDDMDGFIIEENDIYDSLVRINTKEYANSYRLFDKWFDFGKDKYSLTLFETPPIKVKSDMKAEPYFIGINSKNNSIVNDSSNLHKIYLSLKPEYLEQGVMLIMDFVDREEIEVLAKVGRLSRDDQIVIRVGNHRDCDKVLDFINNNQYLQKGKKEANPFSFQNNGIALAADGDTSYNSCMSRLVYKYLKHMKYNNRIDEIGYNSFIRYIKNYYEEHFVRMDNIDEALKDFKVRKNNSDLYKLLDYKYSIKLFIDGLSNDFNYNSYKNFIDYKKEHFGEDSRDLYNRCINEDYFSLFFELCDVMINKYGYDQAVANIGGFFKDGDCAYITGDNNLRRRVDNALFINFINNYVSRSNMNIEDFVGNVYNADSDLNYDEKISILNDGIKKTYEVHNEDSFGMEYAM